jgi:hypothetical protein
LKPRPTARIFAVTLPLSMVTRVPTLLVPSTTSLPLLIVAL